VAVPKWARRKKKRQSDTVKQFSTEKLVTSKFEQLDDLALGRDKMCDTIAQEITACMTNMSELQDDMDF